MLAIDLGTSSIKLLVVDRDGTVLARRRLPHVTNRPTLDAAEQEHVEWWRSLVAAVTGLPEEIAIAGIGVTGQMHGLVIHGADGEAIRPAITWEDRRSASTLPSLLAKISREHPTIAPGYQAASWHWLARTEPAVASRAARLLLPKDEIVFRLTGRHVTDPSDAIGTGWYSARAGVWDADVVSAAGARVGMLPEIVPAGSIAGKLTGFAAAMLGMKAGIPVVVAGGDAAVAAFGAGATDPHTPLIMLSTGCQALRPSATMPEDDAWPSANPPGLPAWLRVATTLNGGSVVGWARETFGEPAACADEELSFLPWLAGERSDRIGANASGAFVGLRARHSRADMARAAIDGVSLALADAFQRSGGQLGVDAPVPAGGGGTRDEIWLASVADALARPIDAIDEPDLSAWGAARSVATALGWVDPVAEPGAWRPSARHIAPRTSANDAIARLDRFRAMASRLFPPGDR